jgi:hypothetical protein
VHLARTSEASATAKAAAASAPSASSAISAVVFKTHFFTYFFLGSPFWGRLILSVVREKPF